MSAIFNSILHAGMQSQGRPRPRDLLVRFGELIVSNLKGSGACNSTRARTRNLSYSY